MSATLADLAVGAPLDPVHDWNDDGFILLPGLIPNDAIDAYCSRFTTDALARATKTQNFDLELARGYGIGTPYLQVPELRDVAMHHSLVPHLDDLYGEPMGLHLNLTGWQSTTRQWHQDQYLNPPCVGMWYAAVWIALDDIHSDAGPFEYVPGSHRWPAIDQKKMLAAIDESGADPDWPWRTEAILGPLFDQEIAERSASIEQFIASKGDVLIWHPNLCHRGSVPLNPALERRTLISHWSVVSHRCDMRGTEQRWQSAHADGMFFALGPVK